eukprot:COSAG01_NODE_28181_length_667_cov_1.000000_1_plen_199_part_10
MTLCPQTEVERLKKAAETQALEAEEVANIKDNIAAAKSRNDSLRAKLQRSVAARTAQESSRADKASDLDTAVAQCADELSRKLEALRSQNRAERETAVQSRIAVRSLILVFSAAAPSFLGSCCTAHECVTAAAHVRQESAARAREAKERRRVAAEHLRKEELKLKEAGVEEASAKARIKREEESVTATARLKREVRAHP